MIDLLFLIVILSLVVYRVGRFIVLDTLIEGTRESVFRRLIAREGSLVASKFLELLGCPYCITIWVAAGATVVTDAFISVPLPVWVWLASAAGSLVWWRLIDWEDNE